MTIQENDRIALLQDEDNQKARFYSLRLKGREHLIGKDGREAAAGAGERIDFR
jgi:hypothetical protein